jgi:hypothetical protein
VSSKDDIVTITTPDGSDTITVTAEADWLTDMTMDDIMINDDSDIVVGIPGSGCDTFTIPDFDDTFKWDDGFLNSTVKIGNTEITESIAEKMVALIDLIEGMDDDAQLKQMFETQVSMNKIRGKNGDS